MNGRPGRVRAVLDSMAAISVTVAAIAVIWSTVGPGARVGRTVQNNGLPERVENIEGRRLQTSVKFVHGVSGSGAGLILIEVADFECPFCRRHATETYPQLKSDVTAGRIAYGFMNLPLESLHARAMNAARAAVCADRQAKFWEMHDWLFVNEEHLAPESIKAHLHELGLDAERFDQCLVQVKGDLDGELAEVKRLHIDSTPTFLLGDLATDGTIVLRRRINGAVAYPLMKSAIEQTGGALSARR
jgi:protein-disulfide isomerase